jgi:TRAP transporter TAXI family solute receptor
MVGLAGLLILTGSVNLACAKSAAIPKMMTWTSYDVGSSGYMLAGHISTTLYEKFGIKIRIIPAGTDIPRVYPIRLKDAEVAFHGIGSYFMQEGVQEYSANEWGPQPVRAIHFAQHPGLTMGVRGDSDIKTPADLKGKRVASFPTYALTLISKGHLAFAGLTYDDVIRVECPSYGQAIRMLMAGKLDCTNINPTASLAYEMEGMPYGLRWLPLPHSDKEGWARVKKVAPIYGQHIATIGAGLSEDKPLQTISYAYPIVLAYDFLPEDKAYIITKLIAETFPDYSVKHKALKAFWSLDGSMKLFDQFPLPMHKGSIRYLKEAGKWTPEREAVNQKRLAHQAKLKEIWDAAMDEALGKKMRMKKFPEFWLKKRAEAGF